MTYLEAINKVLIRLREPQVSTVNETPYSSLIGEFINDANKAVEDAWDWSALRTTLTVTTSSGTYDYSLVGSGERLELFLVTNETSETVLNQKPHNWFIAQFLQESPATGSPEYFSFNGVDTNDDAKVKVYPVPDGAYTLSFSAIVRTPSFTEDTDSIKVPWLPVVSLATALAASERGENAGLASGELYGLSQKYLSDAIALDSVRHPEELVFRAV